MHLSSSEVRIMLTENIKQKSVLKKIEVNF